MQSGGERRVVVWTVANDVEERRVAGIVISVGPSWKPSNRCSAAAAWWLTSASSTKVSKPANSRIRQVTGAPPIRYARGPDRHEQPSLGTSANLTSAAAEGSELGMRDHAELGVGQFGDLQVETGHVLLSASSAPEMENLV